MNDGFLGSHFDQDGSHQQWSIAETVFVTCLFQLLISYLMMKHGLSVVYTLSEDQDRLKQTVAGKSADLIGNYDDVPKPVNEIFEIVKSDSFMNECLVQN